MIDGQLLSYSIRDILKHFSLLLGGVFLFALAHGGLFSELGITLENNGFSESMIGLIGSVFFVGTLFGSIITNYFVGNVGYIRWFSILAASAGISTIALSLSQEIIYIALLRFIAGVAMGGHWVIAESWINAESPNAARGRGLSIYECLRMGGVAVSPFLLGLFFAHEVVYVAAGILFVAALIPVCFIKTKEPKPITGKNSLSLLKLMKISPLSCICCMVAGYILSSIFSMIGIFGFQSSLSDIEVATLISLTLFTPVLTHIPIGFMSDKIGRRKTIFIISIASMAASIVLLLGLGNSFLSLLALCCIISGMSNPLYAIGLSLLNDLIDSGLSAKAGGAMIIINGIGLTVGSTMTGLIMEKIGKNGFPLSIASLMMLVILIVSLGYKDRFSSTVK